MYPAAGHGEPNRSPWISATTVAPSCLSQLWHTRIVGHQSIGLCRDRAKWGGIRHPLVGTAQPQCCARDLPTGHICTWSYRRHSSLDSLGNMALGFSASNGASPAVFPSLFYTGRLVGDPPGQMTQGEGSIINGTGSQTGSNRWGDYTALSVDPTDDLTFWYVNEYVPTTSSLASSQRPSFASL